MTWPSVRWFVRAIARRVLGAIALRSHLIHTTPATTTAAIASSIMGLALVQPLSPAPTNIVPFRGGAAPSPASAPPPNVVPFRGAPLQAAPRPFTPNWSLPTPAGALPVAAAAPAAAGGTLLGTIGVGSALGLGSGELLRRDAAKAGFDDVRYPDNTGALLADPLGTLRDGIRGLSESYGDLFGANDLAGTPPPIKMPYTGTLPAFRGGQTPGVLYNITSVSGVDGSTQYRGYIFGPVGTKAIKNYFNGVHSGNYLYATGPNNQSEFIGTQQFGIFHFSPHVDTFFTTRRDGQPDTGGDPDPPGEERINPPQRIKQPIPPPLGTPSHPPGVDPPPRQLPLGPPRPTKPPKPRDEPRPDPPGDPRVDPPGDPRVDPPGDPRVDPPGDPRVDPPGDPRVDPPGDPAVDPPGDPAVDPPGDPTLDPPRQAPGEPTNPRFPPPGLPGKFAPRDPIRPPKTDPPGLPQLPSLDPPPPSKYRPPDKIRRNKPGIPPPKTNAPPTPGSLNPTSDGRFRLPTTGGVTKTSPGLGTGQNPNTGQSGDICSSPCMLDLGQKAKETKDDLAEVLKLLKAIYKNVGGESFPVKNPLLTGEPGIQKDLIELIEWSVKNVDAVNGYWPLDVKILGADGKDRTIKLKDQSEAIHELFGLLFTVAEDADAAVNIGARNIVETIQTKVSSIQAGQSLQSIIKFLGFNTRATKDTVKISVSPAASGGDNKLQNQEMVDFLTASEQLFAGTEYQDNKQLLVMLERILEDAEISRAALYKPLKRDKKGRDTLTGEAIRREGLQTGKDIYEDEWNKFIDSLRKRGIEIDEKKDKPKND
jgi:hypothetical protein